MKSELHKVTLIWTNIFYPPLHFLVLEQSLLTLHTLTQKIWSKMFIVFAFLLIVSSSLKFKFWLTKPVRRRVPMVPWEPIEASAMREVSDQSSGCSRGKDDGVGEVGCNGSISTGDTRFGGIYEHSMISLKLSSNSFQIKITDKSVIWPLLRYSIYFLREIIR